MGNISTEFIKGTLLILIVVTVSSCALFRNKNSGFEISINQKECSSELKSVDSALQYVDDGNIQALRFTPVSGAAYIDDMKLDVKEGIFLDVKFKADKNQNNPFPRLIEGLDIFSIHLKMIHPRQIKFMLLGKNETYSQVIYDLPENDGQWHKVAASFDPKKKIMSIRLDDFPEVTENVDIELKKTELHTLILGADKKTGTERVFNGLINSVSLTSPYAYSGSVSKAAEEKNYDSPGIEHVTISSIRGRHMAFPGVTKMPDGRFAAVFREGAAHVCPYGRICIVFSNDGGKSWSAPVSIADTESDERDPSIQTLSDDRVLVTHGGWNSWMSEKGIREKFKSETKYIEQSGEDNFGGSRFIFSKDSGKTWSSPVKAEAFCPHGPLFYEGRFYSPSLETEKDLTKRHVVFWTADADGKNWKKISTVGSSDYAVNAYADIPVYEEPYTIALKDGTFITAIRVPSDGYMRVSFSKDKGKTWTEPAITKLRGFPQHLLQLKDGRILATYGYRYRPYGIRACISSDGGKTWDLDNEIIIRSGGKNVDLGYPVSIELEDGQVFTVYYYNNKDRKDCFIEGAFYKP